MDMSVTNPPQTRARFASRWWRWSAIAVAIVAAIILAAWLAIPYVLRDQLQTRLTASLHRQTTIGKIDFNPFTLRAVLHDIAIAGRDGAKPLLTIGELTANVSSASIWHRAPVLDALKVVYPAIDLSRGADGRYSIQDLMDEAAAAPDGPPPAFSLNNIEVEGASFT